MAVLLLLRTLTVRNCHGSPSLSEQVWTFWNGKLPEATMGQAAVLPIFATILLSLKTTGEPREFSLTVLSARNHIACIVGPRRIDWWVQLIPQCLAMIDGSNWKGRKKSDASWKLGRRKIHRLTKSSRNLWKRSRKGGRQSLVLVAKLQSPRTGKYV